MAADRARLSRVVLWGAVAAFVVTWMVVAIVGGDRLPAHFEGGGSIDRWQSKPAFLATMAGIGAGVVIVFGGAPALIRRLPARAINLPSRSAHAYWTAPERRPELDRKVSEDLEWIGAATVALITWIQIVAVTATGDAVSAWLFVVPLIVFLALVLGRSALMVVGPRYRVPRGS